MNTINVVQPNLQVTTQSLKSLDSGINTLPLTVATVAASAIRMLGQELKDNYGISTGIVPLQALKLADGVWVPVVLNQLYIDGKQIYLMVKSPEDYTALKKLDVAIDVIANTGYLMQSVSSTVCGLFALNLVSATTLACAAPIATVAAPLAALGYVWWGKSLVENWMQGRNKTSHIE